MIITSIMDELNTSIARVVMIVLCIAPVARGAAPPQHSYERSYDAGATAVTNAIVATMSDEPRVATLVEETPHSLRFAGRTQLQAESPSGGRDNVPAFITIWFTIVSEEANKTRVLGRCAITMDDPYKPTVKAQSAYDQWMSQFMERLKAKVEKVAAAEPRQS
jgi:hypothetical protein